MQPTPHLPLPQVLSIPFCLQLQALLVKLLPPASCSNFGSQQLLLSHFVLLLNLQSGKQQQEEVKFSPRV